MPPWNMTEPGEQEYQFRLPVGSRFVENWPQLADSDVKPDGIPINIRPPFRFEAGHAGRISAPAIASESATLASSLPIRGEILMPAKRKLTLRQLRQMLRLRRKRNQQPRDRSDLRRCPQHRAG